MSVYRFRHGVLLALALTLFATQDAATATALLASPAFLSTRISTGAVHVRMTENMEEEPFLLEKEYELTEKRIAQRGEYEERLMAGSVPRPLLPNEPVMAASAAKQPRGFGGGASKKQKRNKWKSNGQRNIIKPDFSKAARDHAKVLKKEGLVRIDGALSDSATDALRDFVYDIRTTEANELRGKQGTTLSTKFPTIRRWDLSLPLFEYTNHKDSGRNVTPTIAHEALKDILQTTAVGETMHRFLGTDQAELYELSSYISDPGSSRQVIHADTPCFGTNDHQPILCTCMVALQEVRGDMGPTLWLPRTNAQGMHDLVFGEEDQGQTRTPRKDHFLQTHEAVVGILPKGSCVLFDSRLLHCGTANQSTNDSRALFFFSFKHPNISLFNPGGDTASIRPDLKGRFRLSDFVSEDVTRRQ